MKLLWHSNAPWTGTGYGQQSALFLPKLKEDYDLASSAFYGLEGNVIPWNGIPVMPALGQTHGNETILDHVRVHLNGELREGLVVTLMDVWVLDPAKWRQLNVASWTPVDHDPVPGPVAEFFARSGSVPIAMSKFGQEKLSEAGLDPLYCPHGCATKVYKPYPKDEAREATQMPKDAFVVGMVAANKGNPSRKCFDEALQAFKLFQDRHPEAILYLHTEATGMFDGVSLPALASAVGLDLGTVFFCDQYRAIHFPFSHEYMAKVYSSLDVLLSPSAGEGFGLAVLEAGACGTPAIVSDFSAQPEVCGAGWTVTGRKKFTAIKSWQFVPDIEDIAESLNRSYAAAGNPEVAKKARAHAETYDVDKVYAEQMKPALEQAAERFEERKPLHPVAKARKKHAHKVKAAA